MLTVNKLANDDTPDGLHRMQYAAHILEELCGMPAKGNQEVVADCILALSKSKKLSIKQAHDYLARAVRLAISAACAVSAACIVAIAGSAAAATGLVSW